MVMVFGRYSNRTTAELQNWAEWASNAPDWPGRGLCQTSRLLFRGGICFPGGSGGIARQIVAHYGNTVLPNNPLV